MACRTLACLPFLIGPMSAEQYAEAEARLAGAMAHMAPPPVKETYLAALAARRASPQETGVLELLDGLARRLAQAKPGCCDGALVLEEYACAIESVRALTKARALLLAGGRSAALAHELELLMQKYRALWPQRAKMGGLEEGLAGFARLQAYFAQ